MSQSEVVASIPPFIGVVEYNVVICETMAATITITYGKTLCEEWMVQKASNLAARVLARCIVEDLRIKAGKDS